ncbi:MAG: leucine-rich repeat domain-containing protein [Lachnospiraceae bacterium]|nr:leucine-rich repeat domain-containing protein [Lachnospiraceae bacterium]
MRNRVATKFTAAVLCAAMMITSLGTGTFASEITADAGDVSVAAQADDATIDTADNAEASIETDYDDVVDDDDVLIGDDADSVSDNDADQDDPDEIEIPVGDETISANSVSENDITVDAGESDENEVVRPEGTAVEPSACFTTVLKNIDGVDHRVLELTSLYTNLTDSGETEFRIPAECTYIPADEKLFVNNATVVSVDFVGGRTENLVIQEGAFENSAIKAFYAPSDYKVVEKETFQNCNKLETLDLGSGVTEIKDNAFDGCKLLGSKTVSGFSKVAKIGKFAFRNTGFRALDLEKITNKSALIVTLDQYAFAECTQLTSVTIPENVKDDGVNPAIPAHCFEDCTALTSITIRGGHATVGDYAFSGCTKLAKVEKSKFNVAVVGDYVFRDCTALTTAIFPKTVKKMGKQVFSGCVKLTTIEFWYQTEGKVTADDFEFPAEPDRMVPTDIAKNVVIRGYDGKVKTYGQTVANNFKKYESLLGTRSIKVTAKFNKGAKLTTKNKGKDGKPGAAPGTKVRITVKSENSIDAKRMQRFSLRDANNNLSPSDFTFISGNATKQIWEFIMPYADDGVLIDVDPDFYTDKAYVKDATISHSIAAYEEDGATKYIWSSMLGKYTVDKPGYRGRIYFDTTKGSKNAAIGNWMWSYKSSKKNVAVVSDAGVITALDYGETQITATYKGSVKIKKTFTVFVGEKSKVEFLELRGEMINTPFSTEMISRQIGKEIYPRVQVVKFPQSEVAKGDVEFKARLYASEEYVYDENDLQNKSLYVNADWRVGDSKLVKLGVKNGINNENTITIKKGAVGETVIKASYKLRDDKTVYAYLIVRIEDMNPRLSKTTVTVNTNRDADDPAITSVKNGGIQVELIPYKGKMIDTSKVIEIVKGKTPTTAKKFTALAKDGKPERTVVSNMDEKCTIVLKFNRKNTDAVKPQAGESIEYSGKNTIFVHGQYTDGTHFYSPFDKVTIVNDPLKLEGTNSGKINLFYNSTCYDLPADPTAEAFKLAQEQELPAKDDDETPKQYVERYIKKTVGTVKVTSNIKTKVAVPYRIELWGTAYKKRADEWVKIYDADYNAIPGSWWNNPIHYNNFERNFDVAIDSNKKDFIIKRSGNDLMNEPVEGVQTPITKGYLAVWYEGYSQPVFQKITIPTKRTAPSYVLSATSTKENVINTKGVFRVKLVDSATKKRVTVKNNTLNNIRLTNYAAFKDPVTMDDNGVILLQAQDTFLSGKNSANIRLKRKNWNDEMKLKYTVKYVEKKPTVKFESKTVTLNCAYYNPSVTTNIILNEPNAEVGIKAGTLKRVSGDSVEADKIEVNTGSLTSTVDPGTKTLKIALKDPTIVPNKGTYKFSFVPTYKLKGGAAMDLKRITLTVKVIDSRPTVKFSKKGYAFNMLNDLSKDQEPKTVVTIAKLPKGVKYKDAATYVDVSGVKFVPASKKPTALQNQIANELKLSSITYNKDTKKFEAAVTLPKSFNATFNYKYYVNGIKICGTTIKDKSVKITVKGVIKAPTISVKKSKSINTVDYTTFVKCVPTFNNLKAPVFDETAIVKVINADGTRPASDYIQAVKDEKFAENGIVYLKAIHKHGLPNQHFEIPNWEYKLKLEYTLKSGVTLRSETITFKPKQLLSDIKVTDKQLTLYQGVTDAADGSTYTNRSVGTNLKKTSRVKNHICDVKIANENVIAVKKAFEVTYVDDPAEIARFNDGNDPYKDVTSSSLTAGKVIVTCKYPEFVTSGKVYTIKLEALYDGQFWERDQYGVLKKNKEGNEVLTRGSTCEVNVVVYK